MAAATVATISDVIDQNEKYLQTQRNVSAKALQISLKLLVKRNAVVNVRQVINIHHHQLCHDSLFCKNLRRKDKQWEHDKDKND